MVIRAGSSPVARTKQKEDMPLWRVLFLFYKGDGLEGESVQSGLPVDVRDRGRPSAQFARESSPVARTKYKKRVLAALFFVFCVVMWCRTFPSDLL